MMADKMGRQSQLPAVPVAASVYWTPVRGSAGCGDLMCTVLLIATGPVWKLRP